MDTNTTETKKLLLDMVKAFSDKEIKPLSATIDKNKGVPKDLWHKIVSTGFLGLTIPLEYGGADFDALSEADTIYEVASRSASVAFTLEGHYKTVDQLKKYGNKALQAKYLPQANKRIFAFSSTEPQGGSNVLGHSATAVKKGDHWVLNGNKSMITNGGLAEVYLVLFKTGKDELSCFLVDEDMPGFKHGKQEDFMGMRGTPVGEIFLENVKVSDDHLLGTIGQGIEIGDNAHYDARINMGAIAAGICENALSIATNYAKERKAINTPISNLYSIQNKLVEIEIARENIRLLYKEAATLKINKQSYAKVATIAKSYGSRAAFKAADDAIQVLGGYGYSNEYPVEVLLRDARALQIAEGSLEKMIVEISKEILKERE